MANWRLCRTDIFRWSQTNVVKYQHNINKSHDRKKKQKKTAAEMWSQMSREWQVVNARVQKDVLYLKEFANLYTLLTGSLSLQAQRSDQDHTPPLTGTHSTFSASGEKYEQTLSNSRTKKAQQNVTQSKRESNPCSSSAMPLLFLSGALSLLSCSFGSNE